MDSRWYYEEIKRIDINQLNNICKAFNCEISDLLEYVPDEYLNETILFCALNGMNEPSNEKYKNYMPKHSPAQEQTYMP